MKNVTFILFLVAAMIYSDHVRGAYCNTPTSSVAINPTSTVQSTATYTSGRRAFTFNATAGCTYTFSTCGTSSVDTYLRLYSGTGGTLLVGADDNCGAQSEIVWTCATTGPYSILLTRFSCNALNGAAYMNYSVACPPACTDNSVTLTMNDSFGDGWNGGSITLTNSLGTTYGPYSFTAGSTSSASLCLPDACYSISVNQGSWPGEMTWNLSNGVSGDGYYGNQSNVFALGSASCGAISGCTDPASINYNPLATIDDGSCIYPPSNDLCGGSISLGCGSTVTVNTVNATVDAIGSTNCGTTITTPGVWYQIMGNGQLMTVSTIGLTSSDTKLIVYSGSCLGLTCVGGNDDTGGLQSEVSWTSVSGTTYYVLAGLFTGTGSFPMSLTCTIADPTGVSASENSGNIPNDGIICSGASTTLTASGIIGTAYWFEGSCATTGQIATGSSISVSPTATTTYYVRNFDGSQWSIGCASITITVNDAPSVNASATPSTLCLGGNAQLDASVVSLATPGELIVTISGTGWLDEVSWSLTNNSGVVIGSGANYGNGGTHPNVIASSADGPYSFTVETQGTFNDNIADYSVTCDGVVVLSGTLNGGLTSTQSVSSCLNIPLVTYAWIPASTLTDATIVNPIATPTVSTTYTVTATANGCAATSDVLVTVDQPSIAPTGVNGSGSTCLGITSSLSVQGGSLGSNAMWIWMDGSCGGTVIGTGPTISVTPTTTTTYYVAAMSTGACPSSICASGMITLPSTSNNISGNNMTATCAVNQNGYVHLIDANGDLVASINSNGQNLGDVTATSYVEGTPLLVEACGNPGNLSMMTSVMDRHWVITAQNPPTGPVSVLLPFTYNEFVSLNFEAFNNYNPFDDVLTFGDVGATKYSGPNEDQDFDNDCLSNGGSGDFTWHSQTSNGLVNTYLTSHNPQDRFITIDISSFSEFWLHGSATLSPLPTELESFQADCKADNKVLVSWITASEYNTSHFELARSYDAEDWIDFASIPSMGLSQESIHYQVEDDADLHGRTVYYRLIQFDVNGSQTEYMVSRSACSDYNFGEFTIYPNPGDGLLNLSISDNSEGSGKIIITDLSSKIIFNADIVVSEGKNEYKINGYFLVPGVYIVNFYKDGIFTSSLKYTKL